MNDYAACGAYFRSRAAFDRCFLMMRSKWESYGRTAGQVILKDSAPEERAALEGVLGRHFPQGVVRFSLAEFERALETSRFGAVPLKELLEAYFGEPVEAKKDRREKQRQDKDGFLERMGRERENIAGWIRALQEQKRYGYQMFTAEYDRDRRQAEALLRQTGECLEFLAERRSREEPPIHLALLAARVTGNPHAFDRGQAGGQLLTHAFCFLSGQEFPQSAAQRSTLFFENGVQTDEISSTVAAFGIHLETEQGLHPAYEGYIARREPCVLTLSNLANVRGAYGSRPGADGTKPVYIVENEMVFSHLLNTIPSGAFTLLCTSGQPRTAAFILMDLLAENNARFFYAGDLDPEGMVIADRLWRRYKGKLEIWHMAKEDYRKSMSEEKVEGRRLVMLDKLTHPVLAETAVLLKREGAAGYQEALVEEMREDILKGYGEHRDEYQNKL